MPTGPVLIAYDGSEIAEHALREAAAVLAQRRALVVSVWETGSGLNPIRAAGEPVPPIDVSGAVEIEHELAEEARQTAQRGAEIARQVGFEAEALAVGGEASFARTLIELAAERDAVAIVVGAHGHGRVAEFLGSTSRSVIHHSTCPVLVVRKQTKES